MVKKTSTSEFISLVLLKLADSNTNIVVASFTVFNMIAKRTKPISDGNYIINLKLKNASLLFGDLANKVKII